MLSSRAVNTVELATCHVLARGSVHDPRSERPGVCCLSQLSASKAMTPSDYTQCSRVICDALRAPECP
jgi:hypothetical protein